jgi:hypothetical protein
MPCVPRPRSPRSHRRSAVIARCRIPLRQRACMHAQASARVAAAAGTPRVAEVHACLFTRAVAVCAGRRGCTGCRCSVSLRCNTLPSVATGYIALRLQRVCVHRNGLSGAATQRGAMRRSRSDSVATGRIYAATRIVVRLGPGLPGVDAARNKVHMVCAALYMAGVECDGARCGAAYVALRPFGAVMPCGLLRCVATVLRSVATSCAALQPCCGALQQAALRCNRAALQTTMSSSGTWTRPGRTRRASGSRFSRSSLRSPGRWPVAARGALRRDVMCPFACLGRLPLRCDVMCPFATLGRVRLWCDVTFVHANARASGTEAMNFRRH